MIAVQTLSEAPMWVLSCMRCSACISKQTLFASGCARAGSRQKELGLAAGGGEEKDHLHEKFVCSLATLATNCSGGQAMLRSL